jgi:putative peptide zinc metalloprotease protein
MLTLDRSGYALVPGVRLAKDPDSEARLALLANGRVLRLGPDVGRIGELIAAAPDWLDADDLMSQLDSGIWDSDSLALALRSLATAGLIRLGQPELEPAPQTTPRSARFTFRRPLTLQWNLFDPAPLARTLGAAAYALRGQRGLTWSLLGLGLQLAYVILGTQAGPGSAAQTRLLPALALLLLTGCLHELAHCIVLADAGGQPRRLGLMLFYLTPAFFCDISDSFTLRRRAQVDVALAGVYAQCQIGALVGTLAFVPGLYATVRLYIVFNLIMLLANLVPFVGLDGYIALRAALGTPNLRTIALAAWRDTLTRLMQGGTPTAVSRPRWLAAFGGAASLTPVLAVSVPLSLVVRAVLPDQASVVGSVMIASVTLWLIASLGRAWARGRRRSAPVAPRRAITGAMRGAR